MFCKYCGKQIDDEGGSFCPYCGKNLQETYPPTGSPHAQYPPYPAPRYNPQDLPNGGWTVLGFFFPLVGFILYLVWQTSFPIRSKLCGKGALIGVIVEVVLVVLYIIVICVIIAAGTASYRYGQAVI